MITGLDTSSVALAVRKVAQEKGQIDLNVGAGTADLTGPACSETGAHWVFDTYALAHVTGSAVVKDGGDSWFFVTADYAFGKSLEDEATDGREGGRRQGGGRRQASAQHAGLLLLHAAGAGVEGEDHRPRQRRHGYGELDQAGRRVRHRRGRPELAALLMFANDVQSLALPVAQGLVLTEAFYWDQNDETRAWTKRFRAKRDKLPNMTIAGAYSATAALPEGGAGGRHRRAEGGDGQDARDADQRLHDQERQAARGRPRASATSTSFQVKSPAESKGKDDIYKLVATVPGDQAFRPLKDGHCPYIK